MVTNDTLTQPFAPGLSKGVGYFLISFPGNQAKPNEFKEWSIQYSLSLDDTVFTDWYDLVTLSPQQTSYQHSNIQIGQYYRYRYQIRTLIYQSAWSGAGYAGKANIASPISTETGLVDTSEIADEAVTASKLADGAVFPQHITGTVDPFTFPGKVKSNIGGFVFPDGSIMTTAAINDKSIVIPIAVSSTTWVLPHNLNKYPSVETIDSAGDRIFGSVHFDSVNQVTVTFTSQFSGEAHLN